MSQTLSRMERLARAEEERKRFRQAVLPQESPISQQGITPIPENSPAQQPAPVEDIRSNISSTESENSENPILAKTEQETQPPDHLNYPLSGHSDTHHSIASDLTVALEATVASGATVAPDATVARKATVASEPSSLYPDATVAPETTVAHDATVALNVPVEIRGYGHFTWDLLDRVMPRLDPYEQVVLLRLCRLAWGHKKDTCRVGYDRLQQACNLKKRKLQEVISKLEFLEYIRRLALEQGGADRSMRGTEYQILLPPPPGVQRATVASNATVAPNATVALNATNKKNALKDFSKEGLPSRAADCPDCSGTSWVYPNGPEGGVKRCTHPRVPKAGK
jgi:hypothetical protein